MAMMDGLIGLLLLWVVAFAPILIIFAIIIIDKVMGWE